MRDTIYREDAIKALDVSIYKDDIEDAINAIPSADRPQGKGLLKDNVFHCGCCGKESHFTADDVYVYDMPLPDFCEKCGARLKGADRQQGEVDAVEIYERAEHNLEQGYITIGEFDKRIEPLRHLCYGRPQGEWIPCSERLPQYRDVVLVSTLWGVRVAERDGIKEDGTDDFWYLFLNDATAHPRYVYAWMPLPEPWKGADDDSDNI